MPAGRPVFLKPPGTTGCLDTAAWKLLILNLEDVNARIYGRFSLFLISAVWSLLLSAFRHFIFTDWRCAFGQRPDFAFFLQLVTFSFDIQCGWVMQQPIQDRCCQHVITEHLSPVCEAFVWRQDNARFFIPSVQQSEEQTGFLAGHWQVTYFVQDQPPRIAQLL